MSDRYRFTPPQGRGSVSSYQGRLRYEARNLLRLLDELVPSTTHHYAIEDARRSLSVLDAKVDTVLTADIAGRRRE